MLTILAREKVLCLQANAEPVPSSIGWYDTQGQMVSTDVRDLVYQADAVGHRVAILHFQSYQQSQGGKYECRVAVEGNNLEKLSVCIGECCTFSDCKLLIASLPQTAQTDTLYIHIILNMC